MEANVAGGLRYVLHGPHLNVSYLAVSRGRRRVSRVSYSPISAGYGSEEGTFLEYILSVPSHGFIGFLREHTRPSSRQRGQCPL